MERQELNAPLMQSASRDSGGDDDDDVYMHSSQWSADAAGGGLVGRDEADAAAGPISSPREPVVSKLSSFALAVVLFFQAAGGTFGSEPSLKAAGNFYAIIGFAVMPFVWSLPEAVMTYELSAMHPCASGGVLWVEEAFGETWGLLVGYLGWVSGVTNNACYPVLFLSYVHDQFFPDDSSTIHNAYLHYGILAGITLLLALVNYRGLEVVGKASILIFLVSAAPFLLMVILGIPKVDPQKWLQTPTDEEVFDDDGISKNGWFPDEANLAGIAWRPFINNLYWNFNGFDQASHYSTVVSKRILRNGIGGAFLLVSSGYLLPILIATGATTITQNEWNEGSFASAGTEIGGRWLGNWIVVSAGISLLAQFFSEMSADSMQVLGMADRGQLPSLFSHRSPHDTPTYALVFSVSVILVLLPLPFGIIIELSNFAYVIAITAEFFAFAKLKIRNGDCTKLRKVLYAIMLVLPLLYNVAVVMLASYVTYIYFACVTAFGLLLISAKRINPACCSVCFGVRDIDGV